MLSPLAGKRILVTRPERQSAITAQLLRQRGAEPIEIPLISIGPPPDPARVSEAVQRLVDFDVIAFTSVNAVERFFREVHAQGGDSGLFSGARVAAIGNGTASALALEGVRAGILPRTFVGEALAQAILDDPSVRQRLSRRQVRVLILRALAAREIVPDRLRKAGCAVDVVPVYTTLPIPANHRDELMAKFEAPSIDCVMLTSSSAADRLADLLDPRTSELTRNVIVASIGPITTGTAELRGITIHLTAAEHTLAGLISALETHCASSNSTSIGEEA